jgi:hypothetical protein
VAEIKKILLGETEVSRLYLGTSLVHEKAPVDTTPPITTARPDGGTFTSEQLVFLGVNEPATTYFTTDGSEPTLNSPIYEDGIPITQTTTLKFFSVDKAGNRESVKTQQYNINIATGWRYVRYQGFGDQTGEATTRLIELQAMIGSTNHLLNRLPISGETPAVNSVALATDGNIAMTSGTFPIWWSGAGIPTLTYDLGEERNIDTLRLWMFSTANDPRQTRFRLWVSKNNVDWTTVVDYRNNTTIQPSGGWSFAVPK